MLTDVAAEVLLLPDVASGARHAAARHDCRRRGRAGRLRAGGARCRRWHYARQRQQFGRVIGSYQAVKHRFAELALCSSSRPGRRRTTRPGCSTIARGPASRRGDGARPDRLDAGGPRGQRVVHASAGRAGLPLGQRRPPLPQARQVQPAALRRSRPSNANGSPTCWIWPRPSRFAGQAQHALGDDVALHLRRAAVDRAGAREEPVRLGVGDRDSRRRDAGCPCRRRAAGERRAGPVSSAAAGPCTSMAKHGQPLMELGVGELVRRAHDSSRPPGSTSPCTAAVSSR